MRQPNGVNGRQTNSTYDPGTQQAYSMDAASRSMPSLVQGSNGSRRVTPEENGYGSGRHSVNSQASMQHFMHWVKCGACRCMVQPTILLCPVHAFNANQQCLQAQPHEGSADLARWPPAGSDTATTNLLQGCLLWRSKCACWVLLCWSRTHRCPVSMQYLSAMLVRRRALARGCCFT